MPVTNMGILYHYSGFYSIIESITETIIEGNNRGIYPCLPAVILYDTILQIKSDVNSYCTYDNANVSFTRDITNFTTNPPKVEYITAADTDSIKTAKSKGVWTDIKQCNFFVTKM